jgi:Mce-associated membrane protein
MPDQDRRPKAATRPSTAAKSRAKRPTVKKATEIAPEPESRDAPTTAPRTLPTLVAVGVLGVLVVALVAALVVSRIQLNDNDAQSQARSSALAAAQTYAVDVASYDYQHLDQDFARVTAHATGAFKDQFQKASTSLKPLIIQYKGVAKATVRGAGVVQASTDKATVVVFVDQTVTNTNSTTPRVDRNRVTITLVHQGGQWLISQVDLV